MLAIGKESGSGLFYSQWAENQRQTDVVGCILLVFS